MKQTYIDYNKFMSEIGKITHRLTSPPIDNEDEKQWKIYQNVRHIADDCRVYLSEKRARVLSDFLFYAISEMFFVGCITYAAIHFNKIGILWFYLLPASTSFKTTTKGDSTNDTNG